jgi:hypothetical protein
VVRTSTARGAAAPGQLGYRGHAVHDGHAQVHQDHVGLGRLREPDRLCSVGGLADHLEIGVSGEHAAQPVPDHGVVVRD